MKRTIVLLALATLACGVLHGTSFTWTGGAVSEYFDCAAMWTGGSGAPYPNDTSDTMTFGTAGATLKLYHSAGSPRSWGGLTVTNGTVDLGGNIARSTYTFAADNTGTGDFIVQSVAGSLPVFTNTYNNYPGIAFDVAGDFKLLRPAGAGSYGVWNASSSKGYCSLTMRGNGKVLDDNSTLPWFAVTIANGASITTGTSTNGSMTSQRLLTVNGTISGGTWFISCGAVAGANNSTAAGRVTMGANGKFTGGTLLISGAGSTTNAGNIYLDGGHYCNITTETNNYYNGSTYNTSFEYLNGGTLSCAGDFLWHPKYTYGSGTTRAVVDTLNTDNGSGRATNLNVTGNFQLGGPWTSLPNRLVQYKLVANSSTFTIAGNALFDHYATVQGGTSTWHVGGNMIFRSGVIFDNTSMTGTTVDLSGTGAQRVLFGDSLPLGILSVSKTAGTVTLMGNAVVKGNLSAASGLGGWDDNGFYAVLSGGIDCQTTAQTLDAHGANLQKVHVAAGSSTNSFVVLASDLAVSDNLDIDDGCKLFLNGHKLILTGSDAAAWLGLNTLSGEGAWTLREGGQVIGTAAPEPATLLLLGTGALGALRYVRRRRMR